VTCEYATFEWIDAAPVTAGEVSGEVLELALSRHWQNTGRTVQGTYGMKFPLMDWTLRMMFTSLPLGAINKCVGCLNFCSWQGFTSETLMYNGASWDDRYDYERKRHFYTVTHKFSCRPRSWNVQWRAGEQVRSEGILQWTDDGQPVPVVGPAGVGGWDRMVPAIYDLADFNPLIGLPERPVYNPV
jgi:hypothetical protein